MEAAARPVRAYLLELQDSITAALEREDGEARFREERADRPGGGMVRPRVLSDGPVFERAAVNFSHTKKDRLPAAATERRADLVGRSFEAVSLSLIVHPRNPFVPTTHMNVRCFIARKAESDSVWWFGGGLDLTPYYAFREDVVHWHRTVKAACDPFGADLYRRFKRACDEYFFLPHRGEARGVGGLFFDDFDEGDFETCFALTRSVGDSFLPAYLPIVRRRKELPWGERERDFQLYRRGRYVEFNLLYDRGTRFGLQSGAQIESILASMPPLVQWRYNWKPEPGSEEARLYDDFLKPRDWLGET